MKEKEIETQQFLKDNSIWIPFCGCWLWTKSCGSHGYGNLWRLNEYLAHRVAYRAFKGEIKKDLDVLHICDTRSCINPNHLFQGTAQDNAKDALAKGRIKIGKENPMFGNGYKIAGDNNGSRKHPESIRGCCAPTATRTNRYKWARKAWVTKQSKQTLTITT